VRYLNDEIPKKTSRSNQKRIFSFLQWISLLILLSSAIMLADSDFQLFSPSISYVQTHFDENQIMVLKYLGAPIFCTTEVVKTYYVKMPRFPIRNLNLSIPNPSNFSIYDGTGYLPSEEMPFAIKVEADSTLSFTVLKNSAGNVTSISLMPMNGSEVETESFIKLTYNDILDSRFITMTSPAEVNLGNGSISVTTTLIINNTDYRYLYASQFALFDTLNYGNVTSFTFLANGTAQPSQWTDRFEDWLWASFRANPHSFENFTITAVFGEESS
jgi:hypothetical protein